MSILQKFVEFVTAPEISTLMLTGISAVLGLLATFFAGLNVWWAVLITGVIRSLMQVINTKYNIGGRILGGLGMAKK